MMDMQSILIFTLPFVTLLFLVITSRRRPKLPLPPGPRPLPIIGNLNLIDKLTHRGLAHLANQYGGIFHLKLGSVHTFSISTPEIAKEVLQTQDLAFSNRPATIAITYLTYDRADMAFTHYGPFWRQIRKLCVMKLFSRKRAESWASVREEIEKAVSTAAAGAGTVVNVGELAFNLTKNITFRAAFGAKSGEEQDEFLGILQEISKLFGAFNVGDFVPGLRYLDPQGIGRRMRKVRKELDGFIDRIIDEHVQNRKEVDDVEADMVDEMLAFVGQGKSIGRDSDELRLTRNNIKAIIMDVMFGGTETVASAIEWAMAELLKSPEDLKRLQQELTSVVGLDRKVQDSDLDKLPYLKCVIKETLRLHPPIPLLLHETAEDCEIQGYSIPKKSRVMINVWAIGRDKSAWKDADQFKPSRFVKGGEYEQVDFKGNFFELLPFGAGRRSCPGMQLGLYALDLTVANMAHCFDWELPDGMKPGEMDMSDVFGLTAPRAVRLAAVPSPRLTCRI